MALTKTATRAATKTAATGSTSGTGTGEYKVKGRRATAKQRDTINGCLSQAKEDKAGRRTMIGVVMTITQESNAGEDVQKTGNDDTGIYQQGRNWVSEEDSKDPAASTHAFLVTGPTSWTKVTGGVKAAPGNLEETLKRIQGSVGGYSQWEDEATETVDQWLDSGNPDGSGTDYVKRYSFTRGEQGGSRENSWDAMARLVGEVGSNRWAANNVLYAVSGDELRAAAPVLTIYGDEPWLLKKPAWSWSANRAISEITLEVLAERWGILSGACVQMARNFGPMSGKWLVFNLSGASLDSPETTVILHRPTKLRAEPASEVGQRADADGAGADLEGVCKRISDDRSDYLYGGGHGVPLSKLKSASRMDCSSSVSLALKRAGFFPGSQAITSGEFASSWGSAGKGDEFTVWANGEHVWLEGYDKDGKPAWRFDTSQHDGKSGPAYTTVARSDQARFKPRHRSGH